ncbi:MAG: TIGR02147 family protein [Bdellovibrionales bacterium]
MEYTEKRQGSLSTKNFRQYLQLELLRRCEKNPSYSLRAFAQALKIDHSTLSQLLRGKRSLSEKMLITLANALDLGPQEIEPFRSKLNKDGSRQGIQDLSIDSFIVMSEWYHDAILELMRLETFQNDPKWIAKQLKITVSQVTIALERLERLDLIEIPKSGMWISHADRTEVGIETSFTNSALRKYQKQILTMGIEALENVQKESRHNISSTVAIAMADLPKAKKMLNDFRRKFSGFLQREKVQSNQVYQLGICFYPLTQTKGKEK